MGEVMSNRRMITDSDVIACWSVSRRFRISRIAWRVIFYLCLVSVGMEAVPAQVPFLPQSEYSSDVPWLSETTDGPTEASGDRAASKKLTDLEPFRSVSVESWRSERQDIRNRWKTILGYDPDAVRKLPDIEILDVNEDQGVVRKRLRYETHPGWVTEAYLLCSTDKVSAEASTLPAAVVLHPTVEMSIDEPAGVRCSDGMTHGPRALGWQLARRGFVIICPRNFLWPMNDRIDATSQSDRWLRDRKGQEETRGMKGMGKMLYDLQIAADILVQQKGVDPRQLCVLGHSLGAKEALYAMAFDERFRAGAASEGGIGIRFSNWEADWYLGPEVHQPEFGNEHHQLLGLIAPRAFLIVAGESADGDRGWPWISSAQSRYILYDNKVRLGQFNHRLGHPLNEQASHRMLDWIETYGRKR